MYFIKGIISFISSFLFKIIIAIIFGVGTIILYCKVQILMVQDKAYLLFIGSNFNIIPIIMLELFVLYSFISIVEKFSKKNFEKYSKGLDIDYINKIEEVFE